MAGPRGLFRHWSLEDLQQLFNDARTALLEGKNRVITEAGVENGVSTQKDWNIQSETFWDELNYALEQKSPSSFTPPITRTLTRYV